MTGYGYKMKKYSNKLLHYFFQTHQAGELDINDPNVKTVSVGRAENGDVLILYIMLNDDVVVDARFKAYGSPPLIAGAEFICERVIGKKINELQNINCERILNSLDLNNSDTHIAALLDLAVKKCFGEIVYVE